MDKNYDVAVIGSGLGGLCAAFECLRNGKKVLLVEQHNLPGGYASSFVRGRFEFEPALHEMPDLRSIKAATGVVRYLKDDAGLDINFLPVPEAYRLILTDDKVSVKIPFGIDNFIDSIEKEVPGSRESIRKYMDLCSDVQAALKYLNENGDDINYGEFIRNHGNFVRTGSATVAEVASALKIPRKALDLIYPYWCYLGVPAQRLSFTIWASLLDSYISSGAVIPGFRSHEIASAFLEKIHTLGGTVLFNTRAARINVSDGKTTGIELDTGLKISCSRVICNTSPTTVFSSLIYPRSEVPVQAFKNINSRKHGFSLVVVYIGLNVTAEELGLHDYSYFIAPHMNTSKLYDEIFNLDSDELMQASICLNAANPDCSPKGTSIISITAGFSAKAWEGVADEDYFSMKDRIAEKLIRQFEQATDTSLSPHIEEIEIAAPETFARYTGAYNGIVYGYEPEPWDGVIPRALSQDSENYLQGLYFCGGFSFRCHGYGSSIMSGKTAAEKACAGTDLQP